MISHQIRSMSIATNLKIISSWIVSTRQVYSFWKVNRTDNHVSHVWVVFQQKEDWSCTGGVGDQTQMLHLPTIWSFNHPAKQTLLAKLYFWLHVEFEQQNVLFPICSGIWSRFWKLEKLQAPKRNLVDNAREIRQVKKSNQFVLLLISLVAKVARRYVLQ